MHQGWPEPYARLSGSHSFPCAPLAAAIGPRHHVGATGPDHTGRSFTVQPGDLILCQVDHRTVLCSPITCVALLQKPSLARYKMRITHMHIVPHCSPCHNGNRLPRDAAGRKPSHTVWRLPPAHMQLTLSLDRTSRNGSHFSTTVRQMQMYVPGRSPLTHRLHLRTADPRSLAMPFSPLSPTIIISSRISLLIRRCQPSLVGRSWAGFPHSGR